MHEGRLLHHAQDGISSECSSKIVDAIADEVAEDVLESADQKEWNACDMSLGAGRVILRRFGVNA